MGGCVEQVEKHFDFKFLQWDTDYFGIPSYKLVLKSDVDVLTLNDVYEQIPMGAFLTVINESNNKRNNIALTAFFKENIFFADFNIRFVQKCNEQTALGDRRYEITNNLKKDENIVKIAKTSFKYSRFFNDNLLDEAKKRHIYAHWVNSAFESESRYYLRVFDESGSTISFILFNINMEDKCAVIELIANDKEHQNQGLGTYMISVLKNYLANNGVSKLYVGTQSDNIEGMNFYSKNNFKIEGCNSIYHVWKR